jgi:hypothetical protein
MTIFNINDKLPIYCIFVFFLLVFSDTTFSLFPCQLRRVLDSNLYVKHLMVYLSMTFFIVLLENIPDKNLYKIFTVSFYLYIVFILISKTEYSFFLPILIFSAIVYILFLKRQELKQQEQTANDIDKEKINKTQTLIIQVNNIITSCIIILTIIGFFVYMGRKKYEYKNKFSYLTFIFGKIECKGTVSNIDHSTSIKNILK